MVPVRLQDSCRHPILSVSRYVVGVQANFKPGAATWNTDDPDQQPWLKNKKPRHGGKKAEEPVEAAPKPKPVPSAYMTTAKLTESVQTTGAWRKAVYSLNSGSATSPAVLEHKV